MSEALFWSQMEDRLNAMARQIQGAVGLAVRDLATGQCIGINADEEFSTASTIKIPVLATLMAQAATGRVDLGRQVLMTSEMLVGGSGVLQHFRHPCSVSVLDLATLMISLSDNTATNFLIDLVGMDEVNALLSAHGCPKTRLRRKMIDSLAAASGRENTGTPAEFVNFLAMLYEGKIVNPEVSQETLEVLKVPKRGAMSQGLEGLDVVIANKPGGLDGVTVDAGIAFLPRRPFAMCVMANYTLAAGVTNEVADMFKLVYSYQTVLAHSTRFGRRLPLKELRADS